MNYYEAMTYTDKKRQFLDTLPRELDTVLKNAYIEAAMIGPPFYWRKIKGGGVQLKGFPGSTLTVAEVDLLWTVVYKTTEATTQVFHGQSFDEAFKAAREFAYDNRREFLFSDRDARFKQKLASDKQLAIIKAAGYTKGVDQLTCGQAGALMDCGILRKKSLKPNTQAQTTHFEPTGTDEFSF